jgi:hydrogenase-4 component B
VTVWLVLAGIVVIGSSGVLTLFADKRSERGQALSCFLMVIGGVLGIGGVIACWMNGRADLDLPWSLPFGRFAVRIDALSAVFLLPIFLQSILGPIYGLGYWKQSEHPENGTKLRLFYGLLSGALASVVVAHDAVLFLFAWEVMALSAFFLVSTEDEDPAARRAGWIYFIATHVGTLCLFALFALMRRVSGSFALDPITAADLSPQAAKGIFILAVCGFGLKAGIMPLHVWLPGAHANAPSHVSAVLSGVMLKVGVYGILRTTGLLSGLPAWWGGALLAMGAISGVAGMAFAIGQRDLKRALAYSSIENIGIIFMGIGLAMIGRATDHPAWTALGLAGALLHVWNHSLFKPLLFFGAGSILHGAHTRDIERLGGLSKRMPFTAALFVLGAVSICALPPLNGFASEWLIYQGLFATVSSDPDRTYSWIAFAAPLLALIGALAVAGFVRLVAVVFLGEPRTDQARRGHESPSVMIAPMIVLAAGCVCLGFALRVIAPLLDAAVRAWAPLESAANVGVADLVPLDSLAAMSAALIGLVVLGLFALRLWNRGRSRAAAGTWDCGYAVPTARIQYTGSSFGQLLVWLFSFMLWPRTRRPDLHGVSPGGAGFRQSVPDTILDRLLLPAVRDVERRLAWIRLLQQGRVQIYPLYVPMIILILLWVA